MNQIRKTANNCDQCIGYLKYRFFAIRNKAFEAICSGNRFIFLCIIYIYIHCIFWTHQLSKAYKEGGFSSLKLYTLCNIQTKPHPESERQGPWEEVCQRKG